MCPLGHCHPQCWASPLGRLLLCSMDFFFSFITLSTTFAYLIYFLVYYLFLLSFSGGPDCKESTCNIGDPGSIPELGRSPGEENGNPLQNSCLGNSMERGAWWATVHGITNSLTRLNAHKHTQAHDYLTLRGLLSISRFSLTEDG